LGLEGRGHQGSSCPPLGDSDHPVFTSYLYGRPPRT
jgi:hypothetical protein